jgi:hypothetical protein
MMTFEKIKSFFGYVIDWYKKKKEEKSVFQMQASGRSMVKTNWMDHSYMKNPIQQMGLDKRVKTGTEQFGSKKTD